MSRPRGDTTAPPVHERHGRWWPRTAGPSIGRAYGRSADVIHPPVDVAPLRDRRVAGRLLPGGVGPHAVQARRPRDRGGQPDAAPAPRRGDGPRGASAFGAIAGPTVEMLGWRDDDDVARLYGRCRALVFPTLEDFGITPLEAMAAGRPVLAFGQGGAHETVVPPGGAEPPTGLFFARQTVEDVIDAIGALRGGPRPLRAEAPPPPGRGLRSPALQGARQAVSARPARRAPRGAEGAFEAARAHHARGRPPGRRRVLDARVRASGSTCWARRSGARFRRCVRIC